jgi:hypothetical protein
MKFQEILNQVNEIVTVDIIEKFKNIYIYDQIPIQDSINSCRIDYYQMIGEYHIHKGSTNNEFIKVLQENGYLGEIDINNLNKYIEHIRIALINYKRYLLLQDFSGSNDFSKKMNFVIDNSRFFNLFRDYNIPNYGKFECKPSSLEEITVFIDLYQKSFYCTEIFHPLNNMSPYHESDRTSFFLSITNTNFTDVALRFMDKLEDRMCKLDDPDRFFACYNIIKLLNEKKIDIIEFLKEANDPLLYYIILPLKNCIGEVSSFKEFLSNFSWDEQKDFILNIHTNAIYIKTFGSPNSLMYEYDENQKFILYIKSESERFFYTNMIKGKLFIQDAKIVEFIIKETRKFLNSMNYVNIDLINAHIDFISTEVEKLITPGADINFKNHFLNVFSKNEIAEFTPEVWIKFKELLPFNQSIQNSNLDKIKTSITAKQLALFIRLLYESEIIDNKKHRVEPLIQLISSYFSSVDKDDLSAGSLSKNYYAKDYHADLAVLKAKLSAIQKQIDEMQKK